MKKQEPSMPSLPKRLSLVAQTVDSLREGIQSGHWREFLPGERELCEALQVSRRTLRLALDELQRQGWLEVSSRQRRRIKARQVATSKTEGKRAIAVLAPGFVPGHACAGLLRHGHSATAADGRRLRGSRSCESCLLRQQSRPRAENSWPSIRRRSGWCSVRRHRCSAGSTTRSCPA